jgi:hypothetical protein
MKEFDPVTALEEGGALLIPASELSDEQRATLEHLGPEEVKQLIGIAATVKKMTTDDYGLKPGVLNSILHV